MSKNYTLTNDSEASQPTGPVTKPSTSTYTPFSNLPRKSQLVDSEFGSATHNHSDSTSIHPNRDVDDVVQRIHLLLQHEKTSISERYRAYLATRPCSPYPSAERGLFQRAMSCVARHVRSLFRRDRSRIVERKTSSAVYLTREDGLRELCCTLMEYVGSVNLSVSSILMISILLKIRFFIFSHRGDERNRRTGR